MATGKCKIDENKNIIKLERGWIGQGWGFKDRYAFENEMYAPCYVPELSDKVYTRFDFLKLANGQPEIAEYIFDLADWQHPETCLDEELNLDELAVCTHCGKIFKSYWLGRCPYCEAVYKREDSEYNGQASGCF